MIFYPFRIVRTSIAAGQVLLDSHLSTTEDSDYKMYIQRGSHDPMILSNITGLST